MKKITTMAKKLHSIDPTLIRFNGCLQGEGWFTFQECHFDDEDELEQKVVVYYGYTDTVDEDYGGYEVWSINFNVDGIHFGNSFTSKKLMMDVISAL